MAIKREDIDSGKISFSDLASGRRLPPVHPGEILRDEFLLPLGVSVYELANAIKAPRSRLNDIVLGLNWFLNPNAKVQWNFALDHRDSTPAGSSGWTYIFGTRLALDF